MTTKNLLPSLIVLLSILITSQVNAAYDSQCATGNREGEQNNCTHENDQDILEKQCLAQYKSSSCQSMSTYLNAMSVECAKEKPSGIDCAMIAKNGIYGREASAFADYIDELEGNSGGSGNGGSGGENFGGGAASCGITTGWNMNNFKCLNLPESSSLTEIILNVFYWILYILGIVAVIGFAIAGLMYIMAGGEEKAVQKAKQAMTYSVYGIVVGLAGIIIINAVFRLLSGDIEF